MFCQSCGERLPDGARFCPQCGQNCSMQAGSSSNVSFSFDDELSPIDTPHKAMALEETASSASAPQKRKPTATIRDDVPTIGSTEWRYRHENGSNNGLAEYFDDTLFTISFIPHGDTIDMPLMSNNGMIIPGPVGQFHIGQKNRQIFYLNKDYQLISCDLHGKNEVLIAGGNGDRVIDFVLNGDQLFLILQAKDKERSIFQISQSLDSHIVLKKGYNLRGLAADHNYLYYIDGTALTQRDLKSGAEKVILKRTGLNTFQLYNGYLILTISDNIYSNHDKDNYILLIDPVRMLQRVVAQVAAKNVNCYWDHVFYTDAKNEYIWAIPLTGGSAHLLRNKASDNLNASCGQLFFVDCASVQISSINLRNGTETALGSDKIPEAEAEAFQFSLLNQGAEHYKDYTLNQALLEGVTLLQEYNSKSELFDYVVFLTLPQLNKTREDVPALLKAADYQQKSGSKPIVFVDSTLSHKRGKGFIVATDGIYTDKTFFPYDYTFDCEREGGPQNIRLRTYEKVRFGKEKRTLDISCPMFKNGLEDLTELIYTVYAFSFFRMPSISDGYVLPLPKDLSGHKQPGYITSIKKNAAADSENTTQKVADNVAKETTKCPQKDLEAVQDSRSPKKIEATQENEYSLEMDSSDTTLPESSKTMHHKVGSHVKAGIIGGIAAIMIGVAFFGGISNNSQIGDVDSYQEESMKSESTTQLPDNSWDSSSYQEESAKSESATQLPDNSKSTAATQSAAAISKFIGEYSYDASFENPDGTYTNFFYSLSVEPGNGGVLISEMWRGLYIFDNEWASQEDLEGDTLLFTAYNGSDTGQHTLTFIPAAQSPYSSDTIYIDGDTDMPFTKDGFLDNSYSYCDDSYSNSYILPTDTQYITEADLYGMSKEQVSLARNEIYARYGYSFKSEDIRNYFLQQSWYFEDLNVNANTFGVNNLSNCERANLETIQGYEREMGWN